ncbi:MAG: VPDSG-CTERM sorting domain-containing protein [Verrucomicrobia bacterium]|nr:VPDSG-CTERM sorting domain-containing protein [Verrucomicrobiota bacterium]
MAAVAAVGFGSYEAQATQISGMLNIAGTATFDTNSLATAKAVTNFSNVTVGGGNTGAFASIAVGTSVAMASPYVFNPSTATPMLMSVGGFTFDLTSSTVVAQTKNFLDITGTGFISGNGYNSTPATWAFSSQNATGQPHNTFTFSANIGAQPTPDSGMTVALLGAGLLGLAAFRAKFAKV